VARSGYGIYAWVALLVCGTPALLLVTVTPGRATRRRLTHWLAKLFFLAIGSPIRVEGAANMPRSSCVVVANHSSYLDGIILTAALPPNFTFVIKREMAYFPFAGFLLRRIGSEFVDRASDVHKKKAARRLFKAARSGDASVQARRISGRLAEPAAACPRRHSRRAAEAPRGGLAAGARGSGDQRLRADRSRRARVRHGIDGRGTPRTTPTPRRAGSRLASAERPRAGP
jgi:1-acyl-sn-glycerol-3-phosphate acyltransferase